MNSAEDQIAQPVRTGIADLGGIVRAKAIMLEAALTLSEAAREVLLAYAMTGSAVASIFVVAAPHFDLLLRCIFNGRG